jgi:hypothetical protein
MNGPAQHRELLHLPLDFLPAFIVCPPEQHSPYDTEALHQSAIAMVVNFACPSTGTHHYTASSGPCQKTGNRITLKLALWSRCCNNGCYGKTQS